MFGDVYQVAASEAHSGKVDMVEEPCDAVDQRAEVTSRLVRATPPYLRALSLSPL